MKIVWHMPTLSTHSCGMSLRATRFAEALRDAGHEVTFHVDADRTNAGDEISGLPVRRMRLRSKWMPHWSLQSLARRSKASQVVRLIEAPHDLFISCQPEVISAYERTRGSVPCIFVCAGTTLLHDAANACCAPVEAGGPPDIRQRTAYDLDRRLKRSAERRAMQSASAVIFNSHTTRNRVLAEYGLDNARLLTVIGGVDADYFQPPNDTQRQIARRQLRLSDEEFALVWTGRMSPEKNVEAIIAAIGVLKKSRLRAVLVGDGPQRRELERVAREAAATDRVMFCGSMADVRPVLWAADAFVFPSRGESFGNSLAEAMSCGLACVGFRSDGATICNANDELMDAGRAGLLVETPTASDLACSIKALMDDSSLRHRLGSAARARALAAFSWQSAGEMFVRIAHRVAGQRRTSHLAGVLEQHAWLSQRAAIDELNKLEASDGLSSNRQHACEFSRG